MSVLMHCAHSLHHASLFESREEILEALIHEIAEYSSTETVACLHGNRKITSMEWTLLKKLVQHRGRVITVELLIQNMYGDQLNEINSNVLAVHICNLRRKFPELKIQTIRGVGYVLKNSR